MICAQQGDAQWLEQLMHSKKSIELRVHSLFDHAMNLQDAQNNLYTLVSQYAMLAPNTIQLACSNLNSFELDVGDRLTCHSQVIEWGHAHCNGKIDLSKAQPWIGILPRYQDTNHEVAINLMSQFLTHKGTAKGSFDSFTQSAYEFMSMLQVDFLRAWEENNITLMRFLLDRSIGLGPGLTPSGDDAMVGLFAVLATEGNPAQRIFPLLDEVVSKAQGRTTDVSYATLYQASKKRFNQKLIQCVTALFQDDMHALERELRAVLSIGSTSGADMLHGIRTGLMMFNKRRVLDVH